MTRTSAALLLGSLAIVGIAPAVKAQSVWAGGAITVPMSTFKDNYKTGWAANAGLLFPIKSVKGLGVSVEGYYGSNKVKSTSLLTGKSDFYAGFASLGYAFMPDAKVTPYIFGGGGFLNSKYKPTTGSSSSATKGAYQFGGGLGFSVSKGVGFWVDARYMALATSNNTFKLVPITAGLQFDLK